MIRQPATAPELDKPFQFRSPAPYFVFSIMLSRRLTRTPPTFRSQPGTSAGSCWAFAGRGYVTIRLAASAAPELLVLEHTPHAEAQNLTAAPAAFRVWGLESVSSGGSAGGGGGAGGSAAAESRSKAQRSPAPARELLGSFSYNVPGSDEQHFLLTVRPPPPSLLSLAPLTC